jgi:hypothetical protein
LQLVSWHGAVMPASHAPCKGHIAVENRRNFYKAVFYEVDCTFLSENSLIDVGCELPSSSLNIYRI